MLRVSVLYYRRYKPHYTAFPLHAFRNALRDHEIEVRFFHKPFAKAVFECDVLCAIGSNLRLFFPKEQWERGAYIRQLIHDYKQRVPTVIWFDDADGTGELDHWALKESDLYVKNQLLRKRTEYVKPMHHGNYYQNVLNTQFEYEPFVSRRGGDPAYFSKMALSWNLGLIDWNIHSQPRLRRSLGIYFPAHSYSIASTPPNLAQRPLHAMYRANFGFQAATVTQHRQMAFQKLDALNADYQIRHRGKVPVAQYMSELRTAMVAPSPFGWGEICYRDFEGFASGGVVLKPDMGHLVTWPDYFRPNETYVPYAWDYSDFTEKITHIFEHPTDYEHIAREGQRVFLESLDPVKGGAAFAQHFLEMLTQAQEHAKQPARVPGGDSAATNNLEKIDDPALVSVD